jgi:hypothetical protein
VHTVNSTFRRGFAGYREIAGTTCGVKFVARIELNLKISVVARREVGFRRDRFGEGKNIRILRTMPIVLLVTVLQDISTRNLIDCTCAEQKGPPCQASAVFVGFLSSHRQRISFGVSADAASCTNRHASEPTAMSLSAVHASGIAL